MQGGSQNDRADKSQGLFVLLLARTGGKPVECDDVVGMGKGFVFKNPNATSSCGCGSSFSA